MSTKALTLVAVAGFLLMGCGAGGGASSPPARPSVIASPTGGTALSPAATITNAGEGKSVQVHVGQVVDLALKADDTMEPWQVTNPDAAILAPSVNPAAAAAKGMTLRAFKAVGAGTATISATDRPVCNPGQACSHLIRAFTATVVVVG
ncbi:MAG TPA: hypothetical protein VMW62_14315 [Chloroflexota bacterium]|nr:hypothetical protein [Chloroflexota bacterium]